MVKVRLYYREIQIINILFYTNKPMTSQEIIMVNPKLSQSTVQAILRKLLKNGLIEVNEIVYSGNVLSRAYKVTEKAKAEVIMYMLEEYKKIKYIVPLSELIEELLKYENRSKN